MKLVQNIKEFNFQVCLSEDEEYKSIMRENYKKYISPISELSEKANKYSHYNSNLLESCFSSSAEEYNQNLEKQFDSTDLNFVILNQVFGNFEKTFEKKERYLKHSSCERLQIKDIITYRTKERYLKYYKEMVTSSRLLNLIFF